MSDQNEIQVKEDLSIQMMSDEGMFNRVNQMAGMMSSSLAIPKHLQGDHGACFNVVIQAIQWKMNPFAVAQKTHSIKGNIGYEAQLINAVINAHAPTIGPIDYEFFGPWENILGKFDTLVNKDGKKYNKSIVNSEAEKGCGVRAWATLKGEEKPRVIELFMAQCPVRNSTNWANDPQQQLVYMAQKKWARRFCPEVILGVYSADEMPAKKPKAQNILDDLTSDAVEVQAEVIVEISINEVIAAVGLNLADIEMYFKSITGDWGINESITELGQDKYSKILEDPAKLKTAIMKMINEA